MSSSHLLATGTGSPSALWLPRPRLKAAVAVWNYAGGAHYTSFGFAVTASHLRDFAEIAETEFLLIDEKTSLDEFKEKLCWNDCIISWQPGYNP